MEDGLARDLAAIWQSELTAMAADRELRESWTAMLAAWATAMAGAAADDAAPGPAGAAEPAGAAAAAAASGAGGDETARLRQRIAELERRLAGLDPAAGAA